MVDIHSHLLHGLDDGAATLDQSVAMARMAAQSGTTDLVATPHANSEFEFNPQLVQRCWEDLQHLLGNTIRIHLGCDLHLAYDNIRKAIENPARYSINGLGYLLVEFSDILILHSAEEVFSQLRQAGLTPIVTHPERNPHLASNLKRLQRWVECGVFLQVTAQSVTGRFGPQAASCARTLLKRGLAHFVASDAHDTQDRPPRLDDARVFIRAVYGGEYAELLFEIHPRAVIEGQPLFTGPLSVPRPRSNWFEFWK
ncbi:MAG: exopolysaccharide biosynthesis protein [Acidobacteria bacterium]|nr:exopolysaccharide biosynthesis protein [Acidobacteriota bacterium]